MGGAGGWGTAHTRVVSNAEVRASDAERDVVAERLRTAYAEGRLDATELDERLSAVLASRTRGELVAPAADLPPPPRRPLDPGVRPAGSTAAGWAAAPVPVDPRRAAVRPPRGVWWAVAGVAAAVLLIAGLASGATHAWLLWVLVLGVVVARRRSSAAGHRRRRSGPPIEPGPGRDAAGPADGAGRADGADGRGRPPRDLT